MTVLSRCISPYIPHLNHFKYEDSIKDNHDIELIQQIPTYAHHIQNSRLHWFSRRCINFQETHRFSCTCQKPQIPTVIFIVSHFSRITPMHAYSNQHLQFIIPLPFTPQLLIKYQFSSTFPDPNVLICNFYNSHPIHHNKETIPQPSLKITYHKEQKHIQTFKVTLHQPKPQNSQNRNDSSGDSSSPPRGSLQKPRNLVIST